MTAETAAQYPIITRRSESAFLLSVAIISMIFFALVHVDGLLLNLAIRIGIVLGVAALLNEPFSALEGADMTLPVRIARTPLDLLQYLTTLEPHPQMIGGGAVRLSRRAGRGRGERRSQGKQRN